MPALRRARLPSLASLLLAGCWGNKDLSYPPGLEPLETNVAPWPEGTDADPWPEALELISGEGDLLWAHGRGYVHAPLADTWEALRDPAVDVDRRRVASWTVSYDVPQDYDYCYRIHVLVQDLIDVEWDIDWHHGVVNGDLDDPEAVGIRFFKSEGTSLIDLQAGSISAFRIDDETTALELIEQLDAPATTEEDLTQYLQDLFDSTVAFVHGRPLPEYPEDEQAALYWRGEVPMSEPARREAVYDDLYDLPENVVGEILAGELHVSPRPAGAHALAGSVIGATVMTPFGFGVGGPGGWWILDEPELHLGGDVLVPDLAGWRRERLPKIENVVGFTLRPDWVCEILSPSTQLRDRAIKLAIYAREEVPHVWLVDPLARLLEVYGLHEGRWLLLGVHQGTEKVRAEPFEAVELALGLLWGESAE